MVSAGIAMLGRGHVRVMGAWGMATRPSADGRLLWMVLGLAAVFVLLVFASTIATFIR
jgi:hypothetical protein